MSMLAELVHHLSPFPFVFVPRVDMGLLDLIGEAMTELASEIMEDISS